VLLLVAGSSRGKHAGRGRANRIDPCG